MTTICRTHTALSILFFLTLAIPALAQYEPTGCISEAEQELADLVNQYRIENGKAAVPLSQTLLLVGQWHVADHNYAEEVTGDYGSDPQCNLHSWYGIPGAPYSTCCYTPDHAEAPCMWSKPTEISGGTYTGTGYEAAAVGYEDVAAALEGWKNSPGHNDFILSLGFWSEWTAMGVGVDTDTKRYFLWMSDVVDPNGVDPCVPAAIGDPVTSSIVIRDVSPNPFAAQTTISFEMREPGSLRALVLDAGGRAVRRLDRAGLGVGLHRLGWDGLDDLGNEVPDGIYFVRIGSGQNTETVKALRLRR